jgi:hypothetical protein
MNTLAIMPRWFRTAMVMIVMAGVSGAAGAAYALPRNCSGLLNKINADYAKANYRAALACSAADDGAWDEYRLYLADYTFWIITATTALRTAKGAHCV